VNKEQWKRIENVFYSAMERPKDERDEFVRRACAGDEELLREVNDLLAANHNTESFLDAQATLPPNPAPPSTRRLKYCPTCNQTYPVATRFCPNDREILSLKDPYHLVGRTLIDKYRITALIGLGGMGAVYCARHLGIDRQVAFKILQPNVAIGSEYVVELFEREAKLAGRLSHENIVDVKDAGHTPDGVAYIVMEWLEGRTLDDELSRAGRFGFKRAIGIIKQIANALSEAHAKHVVHRDLKPGNIMLLDTPDDRDQVKVLDFGIGKVIEESTANSPVSALVGTPQYASPEQLTIGGRVDGRSDIYSLGVIFYRMLGGQAPFNCSSVGELLQMQLTATPKPLRAIRPETPATIETLINDMLAKDPANRPQSAAELIIRLNRLLEELNNDDLDVEEALQTVDQGTLNKRESFEQTTEDIVEIPPSPKADGGAQNRIRPASGQTSEQETILSAQKSPGRNRRSLRYGVPIAVVLLAGSYGLYRYRLDDNQNARSTAEERASDGGLKSPSPSPGQGATTAAPPNTTASPGASPGTSSNQTSTQAGQRPSPLPTVDRAELLANQKKAAEHLRRAHELYRQGDDQNALRECKESLRLNPQQAEARQLLRRINNHIQILKRP
jgi:serine/threonine-protein kinase